MRISLLKTRPSPPAIPEVCWFLEKPLLPVVTPLEDGGNFDSNNNLIEKLLKKDLKEVALLLVNDNKSSYQNLKTKIGLLNDLLKFDTIFFK